MFTSEVSKLVDVSFLDARLARDCNSSARLRACWGDLWASVARRLLEVAAVGCVADLALLPYARLSRTRDHGTYDVVFGEGIMIRLVAVDGAGSPVPSEAGDTSAAKIRIMSINTMPGRKA
jgi:hypothetical protein